MHRPALPGPIKRLLSWAIQPWITHGRLPRFVFWVCVFLITARLVRLSVDVEHSPVDFINIYCGATVALQGNNPYDDALLKRSWREISESDHIHSTYTPGLPKCPLLYPPWALTYILPFAVIPYRIAGLLWWLTICCCACVFVALAPKALALSDDHYWRRAIEIGVLFGSFKFSISTLVSGQPLFVFCAAAVGAMKAMEDRKTVLAGVLLALATIKVNLAFPVYLLFLYRKSFKPVFLSGILIAVSILIFAFVSKSPVAYFDSYLELTNHFFSGFFSQTNSLLISAQPLALLSRFMPVAMFTAVVPVLVAAAYSLFLGVLFLRGKKPTGIQFYFLTAMSISLVCYVQYYDFVFLICLGYLYLYTMPLKAETFLLYAINAVFFIPIGGIITGLQLPLTTPVLLLLYHLPVVVLADIIIIGKHMTERSSAVDVRF